MRGYEVLSLRESELVWDRERRMPEEEAELIASALAEQDKAFEEAAYQKWLTDLDRLSMAVRAEED
jgi:hypothetical protein